ncbi:MBL fold metallo-hydrolase [Roseovarius sp. SYSU LYC5161]|uniref:MBL fold metallo-hydrolase n=1 Tax=Roseovarius halophilus (ex Wu et al. 2025) TaxID=3376060 RepID=UPI00399A9212
MSDDFNPPIGVAETMGDGIRRIVAPNPSPMTYRGTNTYLVGAGDVAVIDPGPDDPAHLAAILGALRPGDRVSHILVTHAHLDHSPLAPVLGRETGAAVHAYGPATAGRSPVMDGLAASGLVGGGEGVDAGFVPDIKLPDGAAVTGRGWRLVALWTPGHFGNHLCFAMDDTIFTGDLVMGWASSLVSPPDGDVSDFMASCARLQRSGPRILHPGHGAPVRDPAARLDWLITHRRAREGAILDALAERPGRADELARRIYTDVPAALMPAAARNVLAHLVDLTSKKRAAPVGRLAADAVFEARAENRGAG